mmetsp:Transcript_9732/g.23822  ORF Transcript_9732/g.23822 Transcript_9732/m.23822 type:complete len:237 (+) Transcript_9732:156-866(+)|eukprot:CAMPEP_0181139874 /NCGR_PEP_ID=MMETSP1071-20121207/35011_1 /TAXON_ID=35127 /ORGANISM="Thalassiosira sp., Strain NH16" /LENGTH=236 /DNA_ID=CAMNT_0023226803 /DNA_START=71 /DNA_END=781 /DNA_ORIENTATION=+
MFRLLVSSLAISSAANAFVVAPSSSSSSFPASSSCMHSKKDSGDSDVVQQQAFATGSFVEFVEKKRSHIGKIDSVEHKSSGGARYSVIDSEGKKFSIPDKDVRYSMPCPNSPGQATKLYDEFIAAQDTSLPSIQKAIDITPDLLEMAWEEAAEGEGEEHNLTPASFIELVHAHAATAMEKYMAWKLLQSDVSHIFFKEIKSHGRVVSFKAKTRKHVDAAKEMFCRTHQDDNDICFV